MLLLLTTSKTRRVEVVVIATIASPASDSRHTATLTSDVVTYVTE